jgi:hypothetical protein
VTKEPHVSQSKLHEKPFKAYQCLIKATKYVLLVVLISCEENWGRGGEIGRGICESELIFSLFCFGDGPL